jgi:hypothetical protein
MVAPLTCDKKGRIMGFMTTFSIGLGIPRGVYHFSESRLVCFLDADPLRKLHCALSRADSPILDYPGNFLGLCGGLIARSFAAKKKICQRMKPVWKLTEALRKQRCNLEQR